MGTNVAMGELPRLNLSHLIGYIYKEAFWLAGTPATLCLDNRGPHGQG